MVSAAQTGLEVGHFIAGQAIDGGGFTALTFARGRYLIGADNHARIDQATFDGHTVHFDPELGVGSMMSATRNSFSSENSTTEVYSTAARSFFHAC